MGLMDSVDVARLAPVDSMKRKVFKWMLWVAVGCVGLLALDQVLPYSRSHFRNIEAVRLRNSVIEWELMGRPSDYLRTNKSGTKIFLFEHELRIAGTNFHGFMRMESSRLAKGEYLLVDTNQQVLWCDGDGCRALK